MSQPHEGMERVQADTAGRPNATYDRSPDAATLIVHINDFGPDPATAQMPKDSFDFAGAGCCCKLGGQDLTGTTYGIEEELSLTARRSTLRPVKLENGISSLLRKLVYNFGPPLVKIVHVQIAHPVTCNLLIFWQVG